jgi:hypothetical protein
MSEQELRSLAESYVERQLNQANAKVSREKRDELVEAAIRLVDPQRDVSDTDATAT